MFEIKLIPPEMTYPLRHAVLRPHQSLSDCIYETDNNPDSFHVGAFHEGELVSIASFYVQNHPDFSLQNQYLLRAMATVPNYRFYGAGKAVVTYAEYILTERGGKLLWCKGRTGVQAYYEKLGFTAHGEVFDYPPIGPHIVMVKHIE